MPIAQTGNQQLQQQQRPQEILVDSDDEPEILFVEEKFAKSAPQPLPVSKRKVVASSRPLVKKLGPSILKNIASQPGLCSYDTHRTTAHLTTWNFKAKTVGSVLH